jgi:hypothetical protein
MGKPTYWPSDRNKLPELVDFCVAKGIPQDFAVVKFHFDFSSSNSLILITLTVDALKQEKEPCLSNEYTNCDDLRYFANERSTLNKSLKPREDTEAAVKFFNDTI